MPSDRSWPIVIVTGANRQVLRYTLGQEFLTRAVLVASDLEYAIVFSCSFHPVVAQMLNQNTSLAMFLLGTFNYLAMVSP